MRNGRYFGAMNIDYDFSAGGSSNLIVEQVGRIGVCIIIPGLVFHGSTMGIEYTHSYGLGGSRHGSSLTLFSVALRDRLCLGTFLPGKMMFNNHNWVIPEFPELGWNDVPPPAAGNDHVQDEATEVHGNVGASGTCC